MAARRPIMSASLLAAGLAALLAVMLVAHRRAVAIRASWPLIDTRVAVPDPRAARFAAVGYNELAADLAWSRTLVYYGDGIERESRLADVEPLVLLVNTLDPWFMRPYRWGAYAAVYRSKVATQEEFRASAEIVERGLRRFPDDWELHWILGLRYFLDLESDDPAEQQRYREKGAEHIERAMHLPDAPANLPGLAASMRTKLGQRDRALRDLREMILTTEDPEARKQLLERYAALHTQDASDALARARQALDEERRAHLPYAPETLYILVGPRPETTFDPAALARGEAFEVLHPDETSPE